MYVEQNSSVSNEFSTSMSNPSDDDVNEATAALKGMLGIGGAPRVDKKPTAKDSDEPKNNGTKKGKKGGKQETPKRGNKNAERSQSNPKSGGSNAKPNKTKENKAPQNFAWSAFQASPDASALPIPAFVSPASSITINEPSTQLDPEQLATLLLQGDQRTDPPPIDTINAPRAEDLEAQQIAEAEKAKETHKESQPETTKNEEPVPEETKPESESGINLAALATSTLPSNPHVGPAPKTPGLPIPPTPFSSPRHTFLSPGPYHTPPPHPPQSPYLPPSQTYITIQVQVPPVLGPDRRMVVHSPAGYPVQIIVPDGVRPGMIIPVHVPTGPMIQSPYYSPHLQQQQQHQHPMQHYGHHHPLQQQQQQNQYGGPYHPQQQQHHHHRPPPPPN